MSVLLALNHIRTQLESKFKALMIGPLHQYHGSVVTLGTVNSLHYALNNVYYRMSSKTIEQTSVTNSNLYMFYISAVPMQ